MDTYIVRSAGVESDKNKKYWEKGSKVTIKDFPRSVINAWLKANPPILEQEQSNGER